MKMLATSIKLDVEYQTPDQPIDASAELFIMCVACLVSQSYPFHVPLFSVLHYSSKWTQHVLVSPSDTRS